MTKTSFHANIYAAQIQFLALAGKIGGSRGLKSVNAVSTELQWTNYKLGLFGRSKNKTSAIAKRRQQGQRGREKHNNNATTANETDQVSDESDSECSWDAGKDSIETVATCALALSAVFVFRMSLCYVMEHMFHRPVMDSLLFPAWYGAFLLAAGTMSARCGACLPLLAHE